MSPRLTAAIGWAALVTWVVSNVLDAVPNLDYTPPSSAGPIMMIVCGAAFADRGIRKAIEAWGGNGNGNKKEPSP